MLKARDNTRRIWTVLPGGPPAGIRRASKRDALLTDRTFATAACYRAEAYLRDGELFARITRVAPEPTTETEGRMPETEGLGVADGDAEDPGDSIPAGLGVTDRAAVLEKLAKTPGHNCDPGDYILRSPDGPWLRPGESIWYAVRQEPAESREPGENHEQEPDRV
ncbi:MAG TPA: hypothetical protein PK082_01660 [Phycisphaerae bacterium]|nr:hypothetical protein [Phycisphaerae bacterium]